MELEPNQQTSSIQSEYTQSIVSCSVCDHTFTNKSSAKRHIKKQHPDNPDALVPVTRQTNPTVPCKECNKKFAHNSSLKRHISRFHRGINKSGIFPDKSDSGNKEMRCSECSKNYVNLTSLRRHLRQHCQASVNCLDKLQKPASVGCSQCSNRFANEADLSLHIEEHHPDLQDIIPLVIQPTAQCRQCYKRFANRGNLRKHVRGKHPDKLEELAPINKKTHKCPHCDEVFDIIKKLQLHKKTHKTPNQLKCPLCDYSDIGRDNLIIHYKTSHLLNISTKTLQFTSFKRFESWKSRLEKKTYARFTNRGKKTNSTATYIVYNCHRSGVYQPKGQNIRQIKSQGSSKINAFCPARIVVKIQTDVCEVQFCRSHVGHRRRRAVEHLSLSKRQKRIVAQKIAAKVPFDVILDEMRYSGEECQLKRVHLLTRKDLYNIEREFGLNHHAFVKK